jgi:hypothetical protein
MQAKFVADDTTTLKGLAVELNLPKTSEYRYVKQK